MHKFIFVTYTITMSRRYTMYYTRTIEPTIKKINETFPVLIITGPRQVGKTTLLTKLADKDRKIVSLDNPTIRAFAKTEPELFIQRYAPPVLIDEVQYAPELFNYIKIYVDREKRCGDFWLTSSPDFSNDETYYRIAGWTCRNCTNAWLEQ